jgi:hypothetical protein
LGSPSSYHDPFVAPVEYSPSDENIMNLELSKARRLLSPHLLLINFLSSQYQTVKQSEPEIVMPIIRLMMRSVAPTSHMRWATDHFKAEWVLIRQYPSAGSRSSILALTLWFPDIGQRQA